MDDARLAALEEALRSAGISPGEAMALLRVWGQDDLGFCRVDHARTSLAVIPEVVLGEGKTSEQVTAIAKAMLARNGLAIISRASPEIGRSLSASFPEGGYHPLERMFIAGEYGGAVPEGEGTTAIVTAGTSDLPVAGEAVLTLRTMGASVDLIGDVGVAGIHRLGPMLPRILSASVCIICAGMDAALVSVLGGLFPGPVIALPVSTGYGASMRGMTALFSSLASCSPGIGVVNIDNGIGAAACALRILRGPTRAG